MTCSFTHFYSNLYSCNSSPFLFTYFPSYFFHNLSMLQIHHSTLLLSSPLQVLLFKSLFKLFLSNFTESHNSFAQSTTACSVGSHIYPTSLTLSHFIILLLRGPLYSSLHGIPPTVLWSTITYFILIVFTLFIYFSMHPLTNTKPILFFNAFSQNHTFYKHFPYRFV